MESFLGIKIYKILCSFFGVILLYLMISFLNWSFVPEYWHEISKGIFLLGSIFITVMSFTIRHDDGYGCY